MPPTKKAVAKVLELKARGNHHLLNAPIADGDFHLVNPSSPFRNSVPGAWFRREIHQVSTH